MESKLIFGDCIEEMREMQTASVDFLFTDLPYGTTNCRWDTPINLRDFWEEANRVVKPNGCKALFAQVPFSIVLGLSNLDQLRYEWVWEKSQPTGHLNAKKMPMKAHENILIFYEKLPTYNPQMTHGHPRKISTAENKRNSKKSDIYHNYALSSYDSTDRYPRDVIFGPTDKQKTALHPTQKPVWLCEQLIRTYTNPKDTVLDCCMGSASIGEACKTLERKYIGIDIDQHWVDVAIMRLKEDSNEKRAI